MSDEGRLPSSIPSQAHRREGLLEACRAPLAWLQGASRLGWLTNPRRAAYNRIYDRTNIGLGKGCLIVGALIALRLLERFRAVRAQALRENVSTAPDLELALYMGSSPDSASRWPERGWVRGGIADLSVLTQGAGVPPGVIEGAVNELVDGVSESAALLSEIAKLHPAALGKIAEDLRQEEGEQTRRMAATILANAFVFHEALASGPGPLGGVASLGQLRGRKGGLNKSAVLSEWRTILEANY